MTPWQLIPGQGDALTIVDHASNHVPHDIDLGIAPETLDTHVAWDIGAAEVALALGFPTFLATISRLVVDLNRTCDSDGVVPRESDGIAIRRDAGNTRDPVQRFWHPYHDALGQLIRTSRPRMLLSLHSFTPILSSNPAQRRPWEIGILYNRDDRAARIAIAMLDAAGIVVGDQQPYSGKILNATMNRHGEGTRTPYLGVEVRQDLIADDAGIARWAGILRPVVAACLAHFADRGRTAA